LVLAEEIIAREDIPFTDNSAMDGFAVCHEDIREATPSNPAVLELVGEVPAGKIFPGKLRKKQAVAIYTGAPIPLGADTVVEIEVTEVKDGKVYIYQARDIGANIRKKGEDVRAGEMVFAEGTVVSPTVIGVLASIGRSTVRVYRPPVVAIVSTGSELVDIDEPLFAGAVRNSNTYLLEALLREYPVKVINYGTVPDDPETLKHVLNEAKGKSDVILTTGGVSMGDYDLVKITLEELGFKRVFWKVAQKPGKPLAFYENGETVVFGLPGNPAAVHICFLEYVRPFLLKTIGYSKYEPLKIKARLRDGYTKKAGRLNFVRVSIFEKDGELWAEKAGAQGSGILSTSARSNAIALIPADVEEVKAGEEVEVHCFASLGW
jgi:molybdopterin molybdotransferase